MSDYDIYLTTAQVNILQRIHGGGLLLTDLDRVTSKQVDVLIRHDLAAVWEGRVEATDEGRAVLEERKGAGGVLQLTPKDEDDEDDRVEEMPAEMLALSTVNRERLEAISEAWGVDTRSALNVVVAQGYFVVVAEWKDAEDTD